MYTPALPVIDEDMINELQSFMRIPSISSDPAYRMHVSACAGWLASCLRNMGLQEVAVHPTTVHPVVYAEYLQHPSYPTVLFYGHYDVQPPDPVSSWKLPPFEPVMQNGYIYGRGAADDKGQIFIQLEAIKHVIKYRKNFRVNIRCLFEGAEEIGSPGLAAFVKSHPGKVNADAIVICDTKMLSPDIPAITYSLRGALNAVISISHSSKELHSGTYGGIVHNPAEILSRLIAGLQDRNGTVKIDGFYGKVMKPIVSERAFMKTQGPSDEQLMRSAGVRTAKHEQHYSLYEQTTVRPSVSVTGISSGHTGAGFKSSIPSSATARIGMRLVRGQTAADTAKQFAEYTRQFIPSGVRCKLSFGSMADPVEIGRRHPYVRAAARAYTQVFQRPPVFLRSGGTIPVAGILSAMINAPVLLLGFAVAEDNMHAANERFSLHTLQRGVHTLVLFMQQLSEFSILKKCDHDN